MEKIFILGGRRGLGASVARQWRARFPDHAMTVSSRKEWTSADFQTQKWDLSRDTDVDGLCSFISEWKPQRFFCFAGGGPYGEFSQKNWKDHDWALKVSFMAPAQILHACLKANPEAQCVFTGSAIAESAPDINAASYSAAKHALKGLISSIKSESPQKDVRLYSPGYMNTDMLPKNAAPREIQSDLLTPDEVASDFIQWALNPEASWHRAVLKP